MAAATKTKRQPRGMFLPPHHDDLVIVQPLPKIASLDDDDAFEVLTNPRRFRAYFGHEPARWYYPRVCREIDRTQGRFKSWMSHHYAVRVHGVDPATINDRIAPPPDGYDRRSPWWLETTFRAWAIEEGLMTRRGVAVPYRPSGRPKGKTDRVPRHRRTSPMKGTALDVLAAREELIAAGATAAEARRTLAEKYKISERAVSRRWTTGRELRAAGIREITEDMTSAQVAEIVTTTYRLLMADGRRRNLDNARADVAERLGIDRVEVDQILDAHDRSLGTT